MSIYNTIRGALDSKLASVSGLPDVAYANIPYQEDPNTPFIRANLTPVSRRPEVIGYNPSQKYQGLYSIVICVPENQGAGTAYTYADTIVNAFDATTDISFGGEVVSVDYSEVGTPYYDSPFYLVPVTVGWHTYN